MKQLLTLNALINLASQPQLSHTQQYVPQNTPKNWQNRYPSQNDAAEEAQREPEVQWTRAEISRI
jgi:hypothetical protein